MRIKTSLNTKFLAGSLACQLIPIATTLHAQQTGQNTVESKIPVSVALDIVTNSGAVETPPSLWGISIAIFVVLACAGVAYLCYLAVLNWSGYWKAMATAPLLILSGWVLLIGVSRYIDPASHSLWEFEFFSWAMLTSIYLVVLMTAKQKFEKADNLSH